MHASFKPEANLVVVTAPNGLGLHCGRKCFQVPFMEMVAEPIRPYSRSPKNPTLQLLQKSSKSATTTPQRPIWNTFGTVAVRDFWENGCMRQPFLRSGRASACGRHGWSLRQKLDSRRQADRRLGQSNAQKRLFDRPGLSTFWRNDKNRESSDP